MVEGREVASALVFQALVPPHPALSLGERENRPPLRGESNALRRAGVSAWNRRAHGASGSDARLEKDAGCPFPLPAGEGQGEGERDAANPNGRTNFASSARPAPRFRVGNGIERAQTLSMVEARAIARVAKCRWLLSGDEFSIPAPSPSAGGRENGSLASNGCLRFCRLI